MNDTRIAQPSTGAPWSAAESRALYRVENWGEGYFGIDEAGQATAKPQPGGPEIALTEVVAAIEAAGLRLPALVRFTDVLGDRVARLLAAFDAARARHGYAGGYEVVYPVKVNQQRTVVEHIVKSADPRVGLEAGSKPELMAVLALTPPGRSIVCNGYKDSAFIRLAMAGARMGQRLFLVVEKPSELDDILAAAGDGPMPQLGLRVRLASVAAGHWQNTGGDKAKFGLTAAQVVAAVERLRAAGRLDALTMLHLHVGSQVADRAALKQAMAEAGSLYRALRDLGAPISVVDVGGGLAVDYEGRRATSFCSMNYGLRDYADIVTGALAQVCARHGLPAPAIVSESGRALTAHHAVLLTEVIDSESFDGLAGAPYAGPADPLTAYYELTAALDAAQAAFTAGETSLPERAEAEHAAYAGLTALAARLDEADPRQRQTLADLREKLAAKYFCNFSVFQSVPDVWALDQVFPVLPLQRLDEYPGQRVRLCDLTCDSDGRMDRYVDAAGVDSTLPLHALVPGERYLLGIFMVGAYQENLGDMHNLFGDTDAVNVELDGAGGWRLTEAERGDAADELLRYVHFEPDALRAAYAAKVDAAGLVGAEREACLALLEDGLRGYTYLLD